MSLPTSEHAKRLAGVFHRKLTTHWNEKEIRQLRKLVKSHCFDAYDDLALLERYYASEKRKGDKGIHRRDLYTLLNNWQGEIDRATAWQERLKKPEEPRKIIPLPLLKTEPYLAPTDPEEIKKLERFESERRARKSHK